MPYAALNTQNRVGYRPGVTPLAGLGFLPGGREGGWKPTMRGFNAMTLGAMSADEQQLLVADGLDAGSVSLASSLGATDTDAENILALNDQDAEVAALETLIQNLNNAQSASAIAAAESGTAAASATSAAQSPSGSTLSYTATYNINLVGLNTPTNILAQVTAKLPQYGMSIVGTQPSTGTLTVTQTITVLDQIGHQNLSDAKSVLDSLFNSPNSNGLLSSSISLVSTPQSGAPVIAAAPAASPSLTQWFETNAETIGIAAAVLLVGIVALNKMK